MELLAKVFQLSRDVKGFESLDYFVFYFSLAAILVEGKNLV